MPKSYNLLFVISFILLCTSCSEDSSDPSDTKSKTIQLSSENEPIAATSDKTINDKSSVEKIADQESTKPKPDYKKLRSLITYGKAAIVDVKQALTETDVVGLTNTLHALYSMRWHRGVYHLYYDLWHLKKDKHPDFAWESLEKVPARIALASTINRAQIYDAEEFKDYIRSHKYDKHEFHRAQVVVALGLNGDPDDVEYIKEMANGDNHYVTQSAISSLAMVGHVKAKDAMIELYEKHRGTARGRLILDLLKKAYNWQPEKI